MKKFISIFLTVAMLFGITLINVNAADTEYKLKAGETMSISIKGTELESAQSSAPKVAKVKDKTITALTKGNAVITAKLKNGKTLEYKITVTSNPKIIGKKKKAEKNSTFKIDVKGAATKIKYFSSKPKVAKITSDGVITTKKVGNTVIKAKVNGKTLSFKLKVYVKKIVNRYKETFKKGYTYMLYYSEVGKTPTIVSGNPKVVKVTKSGKLKAKKRGKATVTFSHKNAKAIVKITVK